MPNHDSTDGLVTSTLVTMAKIGEYLLTIEEGLQTAYQSGLAQIAQVFGDSAAGSPLVEATRERYESDLARAFRYSAIILLYTTFESRSRLFMEDYEARYGVGPKGKNGTYVTKLRYWMESHSRPISISRPKIWQRLEDVNVIRNSIAHSGGLFRHSARQADLLRIIATDDYLHINKDGYLEVAAEYPFRVSEWVTLCFNLAFSAAGYPVDVREKSPTAFVNSVRGFEDEIAKRMGEYYENQCI
jgi:hypothetical protein